MKKLFCIVLAALLLTGLALAENVHNEITLEAFDGIWVADTVFADGELHAMSEYRYTMIFKIENGHAQMAEEAVGVGSRVQEFEGTLEDGKLLLKNAVESVTLSFNEEGAMVWAGPDVVYTFYLYQETE